MELSKEQAIIEAMLFSRDTAPCTCIAAAGFVTADAGMNPSKEAFSKWRRFI